MTDDNMTAVEMEAYIKCSNCKCKFHNKDENIAKDFGYNRLGKRFKCCVKCKEKRTTKDILENTKTTNKNYKDVDKDMRKLYEKEFNISSFDESNSIFTREEQIERYAKMMAFWKRNMPNMDRVNTCDTYKIAKMFYISNMIDQLFEKMRMFDNDTETKINIRVKELLKEQKEDVFSESVVNDYLETSDNNKCIEIKNKWINEFFNKYKFLDYDEVKTIIEDDDYVHIRYNRFNHDLLEKIWNEIFNDKKIKIVGGLINTRGGFNAMSNSHTVFIKVVRHILKQVKLLEVITNVIYYNSYKNIAKLWDGIGEWRE
jgi:hypothetical protein